MHMPTDEEDPPRNFTLQHLLKFNGITNKAEGGEIYISVNTIVFDVSAAKDLYGRRGDSTVVNSEGGGICNADDELAPYAHFAGHECGVALARRTFLDDECLDDFESLESGLNEGERAELQEQIVKFTHTVKYPIRGRLIPPTKMRDPNMIMSMAEVEKNNGTSTSISASASASTKSESSDGNENENENDAIPSIYVGAGDKVFDMSFGGAAFYGPGCSYHVFAGRNATRCLALMSLEESDAKNPNVTDLDASKIKTLIDWMTSFENKRFYPVVGRLELSEEQRNTIYCDLEG
mmetsp:Transcript_22346/g.33013  ORF Transcript_22346/g.33013 Transcript_22346/m.33013 type:complete len:293 (-) Transcript_22346:235-1113(-)